MNMLSRIGYLHACAWWLLDQNSQDEVVDTGLHTTPQLHWMLRRRNRGQPCAEGDYYASLAAAFQQLVQGFPAAQQVNNTLSCLHGIYDLRLKLQRNCQIGKLASSFDAEAHGGI